MYLSKLVNITNINIIIKKMIMNVDTEIISNASYLAF